MKKILLLLAIFPNILWADATRLILKKNPSWGEEAIVLSTNKGELTWNTLIIKEAALKTLSKAKKGQCLIIKTTGSVLDTDGDAIESIQTCKK